MSRHQRFWRMASLLLATTMLAVSCSGDTGGTVDQASNDSGRTLVDSNGDPLNSDPLVDDASGFVDDDSGQGGSASTASTTTQAPDPERAPPSTDELIAQASVDPEALGEQPEPGSGTPDLEEELEAVQLDSPCDFYDAADLSRSISEWSAAAGVFPELPSGLGSNTSVEFSEVSSTGNSCEWFSDSHLWFVGVWWEVADPTFVETISQSFDDDPVSRQFETPGVKGYVTNDSTAQILTEGLLITVNNLVPGSGAVTGDIDVTEALARDIASQLA